MKTISLAGTWRLSDGIPGHLPGSTYLDLMANGKIPDPFWGQNETEAKEIADRDYEYSRAFTLTKEDLEEEHLDLVISGLDTLGTITLNDKEVGRADNVFRTWRFDVKDTAHEGENTLHILFENPLPVMQKEQAAHPMFSMGGANKGIVHIRKVQSHFGWDWGPCLPPAGISGDIALESYTRRIEDCVIRQEHAAAAVTLHIRVKLNAAKNAKDTGGAGEDSLEAACTLTAPDGTQTWQRAAFQAGEAVLSIPVENPRLWWCNGLGEQPLYKLRVEAAGQGAVLDSTEKTLGLRTITVDTHEDTWGAAFRFVINGVPLFARGADWIPSDSFVTRTTAADLRFYIESAKWANMNMIRVWGGGYYESDTFYDLCDECGILVWQDFCFACGSYPFDNPAFTENVHQEVIDNVRRLRHRASLAIWSGNNENEILSALWKHKKDIYKTNNDFYYDTLADWTAELDGITPYWPGCPSSGKRGHNANDINFGDTHLWQVWHGLQPIEYFRKMPTRFCSEFGLESFPSMRAVGTYTKDTDPKITDPVMMAHQKSAGGNQKILFYLLAKYRGPKKFSDMVYLSQLVQSGAMRFATDQWRRNMDRCGGAIYWQYNDCWPVASWAGIDYAKQYKALHYHARHFNKPICLSNDYYNDRAEIHLANDLPKDFQGILEWRIKDFSGHLINSGETNVSVPGVSAQKALTLNYCGILKGARKNSVALSLTLHRENAAGEIIDEKNYLLSPDKFVTLPKPRINVSCAFKDGKAHITLNSDTYARYVYLEVEGTTAPLSDNFFDINGGGSYTVTLEGAPQAANAAADFAQRIKVHTLADVESAHSLAVDSLRRFAMRFQRVNLITWLLFKFV
ncbi:MAG: hypothetical protein LBT39_10090 [Treponema sp.]|jgi:beta-mannosidase|nr:hypothetical protein [Treponema sp.]